MKLVSHYMKRKIVFFKPNDSIFDVAEVLSKKHISGGPVVQGKKVIGVISETNIIEYMKLNLSEARADTAEPHVLALLIANLAKDSLGIKKEVERLARIKVKDLMSTDIVSISSDNNILEAATIIEKNDIERLPVIDNGKLTGIITRADLLRALID
jgi:CBS domain-containing protein